MTASLYQSGSAADGADGRAGRRAGRRWRMAAVTWRFSQVVLEFGLAAEPRPDVQDGCRRRRRIQLDPVARALPQVGGSVQEVDRLVHPGGIDSQLVERQLQRAVSDLAWIQVHHRQDDVREVRRPLRVGDEPVVADGVERQALVRLECAMLVADTVYLTDERGKAVGSVDRPLPELVFLGVEVFLAARLPGSVLHELEGGAVDAVAGRQRLG